MSFFNTLSRGFGRSSKKNKTAAAGDPQQPPSPIASSSPGASKPYGSANTTSTAPSLGASSSSSSTTPHNTSAFSLAQQQQQSPVTARAPQPLAAPAPVAQKSLFSVANSSSHSLPQATHQPPPQTTNSSSSNSSSTAIVAASSTAPTTAPAAASPTTPSPSAHRTSTSTSSASTNNPNRTSGGPVMKPLFLCQPFVRTALVRGSFQTLVQVPRYVDQNEWLVLNVFEFYQYLNLFYGAIAEFVTPQTCPTMNAGPGIDYTWIDSNKKQVHLPANTYIDLVLTWISNKFDDTTLFPTKQAVPFPPHFLGVLKSIYRQMFRIFAHVYHNHFDKFVHLSMEAHWNSFFAHFISFGKEFDLLDRKEMEPLLPLIEAMEAQGKIMTSDSAPASAGKATATLSPSSAMS